MRVAESKLNFKLRTLMNCGIVAVVFIPAVFIFAQFPGGWLATIALIGILYYVFFYILQERAESIRCPHCLGYIATNTPWKCGFCGHENRRVNEFPFVYQCENCHAEPKAYQCHHATCRKLIFLSNDKLAENFASCLNLKPAETLPPVDKSTAQKTAKEDLLHEIEMAELAAKLNEAKKRSAPEQKKGVAEEIEDDFTKFYSSRMGAREYARKKKAENAEKFKDDPQALQDSNDTIDAWLMERGVD
jgi:hypothetical protein